MRNAQDLKGTTRSCTPGLVLEAVARWVDRIARRTADVVEATLRTAARPAPLVGALFRDVEVSVHRRMQMQPPVVRAVHNPACRVLRARSTE